MNTDSKDDARNDNDRSWHAMEAEDVLSVFGVGEEGLNGEEARKRIEEHGPNTLPSEERPSAIRRLARQFKNVLIYVLLGAALVSAFLEEWVDMAVILAVVLINAVIGFIQEGKAEKAMESIRKMLSPKTRVLREGDEEEIDSENLVPGDIVILKAGDRVPADLRIIETRNAQVEEAALTGESEPVSKQTEPVEENAPLGDRKCMAYSGTLLASGQFQGVVVATGSKAEIGRISEMVSGVEQISTPLLRKIDHFGRQLSVVIILISIALFATGYFFRGFSVVEMFMAAVSLAVAAIPEGLPAIMTITLALGVQRMARRNAIVRRLPAVETLGSVTVICADKTGTLTRSEMTVAKVAVGDRIYTVTGTGYKPEGEFILDEKPVSPNEHNLLLELTRGGLLASDARLREKEGSWTIEGMPTEGSVVVLAYKAGLTREQEQETRPRLDVIPFESERRYMASLHKTPEGESMVYAKGAPERILDLCSSQSTQGEEEPLDREKWIGIEEELAGSGHRVLAVAAKSTGQNTSLSEDAIGDMVLLGFVGIIDPPRDESRDAVKKCQEAGIQVKMITGDHALTARSIGKSMGIGDGEHAVTGSDLETLENTELAKVVEENSVFARTSPEHKLRMIEALQSKNHVVSMTGDGVNDAPALKRADVGVAMGIKGSEAAKEAAEIVLADDNFATIERAVEEGRTIYDNLIKTIMFILPTNGAQSFVVISSVLILFHDMPITPLQILWVNMVTAVTLALALAFEPPEKGIMRHPPRQPDEPIISRYLLWRILFVSVIMSTATMLLFSRAREMGLNLPESRTVAVNTLVVAQIFYLFNSRYSLDSSLNIKTLFGNKAVLIVIAILLFLQLGFTYFVPVQSLFGTSSIALSEWGWIVAAGVVVFLLVEVEKAYLRRKNRA